MMSRPREAIISHKIVYSNSFTNYDKSSALSMEADALVLLGENKKAIKKYKKALKLTKYQFSIYLPLSESYKEMEISRKKWLNFLYQMEEAVDYWEDIDRLSDEYVDLITDQKNSLLFYDVINGGNEIKSDVYWAMYTAAEKCMFSIICRLIIYIHDIQLLSISSPLLSSCISTYVYTLLSYII
jgi:tetratricopeptide (TPR) repeat protein